MKPLSVCIVGLMAVTTVNAADEPTFKAAVATQVITPSENIWMAGYAARTKPAEGKLHDLYAKALCLEDATGKRLVLVTTDLIGIPRSLGEAVATAVEKQFGIPREALILSASHTHCGPVLRENLFDMYPMSKEEAEKVIAYTRKLERDLIALIGAALKNLQPVALKHGAGKATFAVNRREPTPKGIINGRNPAGPVEHTVPVLVVETRAGQPLALVFGYACHNTTLSFYQWCGDYAGFAQIALEKARPGTTAMFWAGCGGDANPLPRGQVEHAQQYGQELANAVLAAMKDAKPIQGRFAARYETIALKFDQLPTKEQLRADLLSKNRAVQKRAERLLQELETRGQITDHYPHYPIQAWAIGDQVLLIALGGEVVVDYHIRLKKELPTSRTLWVMAYANDVMSYIPSARVLKEGGYEADSSQIYYGMPGQYSPTIEDAIIAKVKQLAHAVAPLKKAPGPKTPHEEKETFRLDERFRIELVACEPAVVDPVAMCFDARGRMFVCEMRGYPNGGVGTGVETRGRIQCLEDRDGDGYFETATTFAKGLRFPMGIAPYKNGVIVAVAPDILFLEDTTGDGQADKTTVLYTGFELRNIQQMVNSLQWGLDGWLYGIAGNDGGTITSPQKKEMPPLVLRNRGFRFRPDVPGSIEPTSSGGQYGLTADDYGRWFTATNSQHIRQIVLPDHYLKRNPYLAVAAVTVDIAEHGAAARVFRISDFEPWRVERTTRRAGSADAQRFPSTELVPGGYFTSACSPLIYTADLFGEEFRGNNFVCCPANNLIHRELLRDNGSIFKAVRAYDDREFLASTDNWFRPVHLSIGPDGAMYVLDFYREVIETPLSLPDDIKQQLNLESRGRGRIWRIAPKDFRPGKMPDFHRLSADQLAGELLSANSWRRLTAQRLLLERGEADRSLVTPARFEAARGTPGLSHLLWTLHHLNRAEVPRWLHAALADPQVGNREQALRLAEAYFTESAELRKLVAKMVDDPAARVRFQLALTAGALPPAEAAAVLAAIVEKDARDPWTVTAALSSARACAGELLDTLLAKEKPNAAVLSRLATMIGAQGDVQQITRVLQRVANGADPLLLDGLGQGLRGSPLPLPRWWSQPPTEAAAVMAQLRTRFDQAATVVRDANATPAARVRAANWLAYGPFETAAALTDQLTPHTPPEVQIAIIQMLSTHTDPSVGERLLKNWSGYGPTIRAEVLAALISRPERVRTLLAAVEAKKVSVHEFTSAQIQQLQNHPNATIRAKAVAVFQRTDTDRAKVVKTYFPALELKGDPAKGQTVFRKTCAACHRLDGFGNDVGANLVATLPNKSGDDLLVAIFDPNREVDPRYVAYTVVTSDERVLQGVIATETPTSLTLRLADGKEEVILRSNVASLRSTGRSLMPEGLEKELSHQDVADLFAYFRSVVR